MLKLLIWKKASKLLKYLLIFLFLAGIVYSLFQSNVIGFNIFLVCIVGMSLLGAYEVEIESKNNLGVA